MKSVKFGLLAALAVCLAPTVTYAGLVTGSSYSGPGGTGHEGGFFSNVTEPVLLYSSIDYLDVAVTVDSPGNYNVNIAPGLGGISNFTGEHWAKFQIQNLTPGFGSFLNDWSYYTSPFSTISKTATFIEASGGAGVNHNGGMAMFGTYATSGAGTFIFRAQPVGVPEPATITLLGVSLLVFAAGGARRLKKTARSA